jgi:putative ABC transport system permease protein
MRNAAATDGTRKVGMISVERTVSLALRELRNGLGGFYVFIACIALGVLVITAVGGLADALRDGFARQGEAILGGDISFSRSHARAEGADRAWFESQGRTSETATLRSMARTPDGHDQALVELKGVDGAYPLAGDVKIFGPELHEALKDGGVVANPILLQRLGLKIGDVMRIGDTELPLRGTVLAEPDAITNRLTYGPRVFLSLETLERTGLIKPGTLVRWRYALKLPESIGESPVALAQFREQAKTTLSESGFSIKDRRDPSPRVTKTLDRLRQFLTLLGLTALLVGGIGVANAVATFLERRKTVIATMKSLGAPGFLIFRLFVIQVLAIAAIGVSIGIAAGVAVPYLLTDLFGELLPIPPDLSFSWSSMFTGGAYGFLVALLFTLWPLGKAELVSARVLFRDEVSPEHVWPRLRVLVLTVLFVLALAALAVLMSESKWIALYFCLGIMALFGVFAAVGTAVSWIARRTARSRIPEVALAIGNLGAPGGLTRSVALSLGSGLSLLVAVALADASLVTELTSRVPTQSPNYFVLDIAKEDFGALSSLVERQAPGSEIVDAPMLRGRLVSLAGKSVDAIKAPAEAQWVLNGDRGLTYSDVVPAGSRLVEGEWWPKDYAGEPRVSFDQELAEHLGLSIGDKVTVNVLGRNVTATIANLREVKWETLALNFVMVFSPNTLAAAPHNLLATITLPKNAALKDEADLARALGQAFPNVSVIRVKDAIDAFTAVFAKVMLAVRVAGSVTLLAGALVLAGALATAQRRRVLEAVIFKVLGATRWRILKAHFVEYSILASVTGLFSVAVGAAAAWVAVSKVMQIEFHFGWGPVAGAMGLALGLVILFGAVGTWGVVRARSVPYLRSESR